VNVGEWATNEISYLRPNRLHCDLCGRPIVGRYWVTEIDAGRRAFCEPGHEQRYIDYWLPRYGPASAAG